MSESLEAVRSRANMAAAELRHAYRIKQDWELVARAIRMLEAISTPVAADAPPEPTTAEAFAALHRTLKAFTSEAHPVFAEVAMLERRMGAMTRALTAFVRGMDSSEQGQDLENARLLADEALTDAPPVFTLEEVEALERVTCECPWRVEATRDDKHAAGCAGGRVRETIAAMRRD